MAAHMQDRPVVKQSSLGITLPSSLKSDSTRNSELLCSHMERPKATPSLLVVQTCKWTPENDDCLETNHYSKYKCLIFLGPWSCLDELHIFSKRSLSLRLFQRFRLLDVEDVYRCDYNRHSGRHLDTAEAQV